MIKERRVQVLRSSPFFPPIQVLTRNHLWYHSRDFPWGQFFHLLNPKSTYSLKSRIESTIDSPTRWAAPIGRPTQQKLGHSRKAMVEVTQERRVGKQGLHAEEQRPARESMGPPSTAELIKKRINISSKNTGETGRFEELSYTWWAFLEENAKEQWEDRSFLWCLDDNLLASVISPSLWGQQDAPEGARNGHCHTVSVSAKSDRCSQKATLSWNCFPQFPTSLQERKFRPSWEPHLYWGHKMSPQQN